MPTRLAQIRKWCSYRYCVVIHVLSRERSSLESCLARARREVVVGRSDGVGRPEGAKRVRGRMCGRFSIQ